MAVQTSRHNVIAIAGAGRIGQALGRLLQCRGERVVAVASRTPAHAREAAAFIGNAEAVDYEDLPARASRILIAVPDDALAEVAAVLARTMVAGIALHTCGTRTTDALGPLQVRGTACGVMHPLQTAPTPEQGVSALPGAWFGICGDNPAVAWAERLVSRLDGRALRIKPDRQPLYHAAAVMASNYVVALIDASVRLMQAAGVPEREALDALAPLIKTSAENAIAQGPLDALTGPIQRGDAETVLAHLLALRTEPAGLRRLYCAAGLEAVDIAGKRGLSPRAAAKIRSILRERGEGDA